jgi:hypothetical protein
MKMLTEAEHAELLAARDERDQLRVAIDGHDGSLITEAALRLAADRLVEACDRAGFVLTVEQWSVPPLAMGRHRTIASLRPSRTPA